MKQSSSGVCEIPTSAAVAIAAAALTSGHIQQPTVLPLHPSPSCPSNSSSSSSRTSLTSLHTPSQAGHTTASMTSEEESTQNSDSSSATASLLNTNSGTIRLFLHKYVLLIILVIVPYFFAFNEDLQ